MRLLTSLLRIAPALAGMLLTGCDDKFPDYRYRMTVEVQTPNGVRTGSGVVEVETESVSTTQDSTGHSFRSTFSGEAVPIDVGNSLTLFALLGSPENPSYGASAAHWALKPERTTPGTLEGYAEDLQQLVQVKGAHDLPRDHWPLFVHFRNRNDPASAEEVKPGNASEALGPGYYIRRVVIELTDDEVTTGIQDQLPWFRDYLERHFDGSSAAVEDLRTSRLAARLSSRSFSTEAGN